MKTVRSTLLRTTLGVALLAGAASAGAAQLAPYFYTWGYGNTTYAVTSLVDARNKMGLNAATLAFVVSAGGCTVDNSVSNMQSDIVAFQNAGGRVIISFGGANGTYLESTCSATQLTNLIDGMLQTTGVRAIDFDVEGGQLGNPALNTTRNAAIKALRLKYPNLYVSLTLPSVPVHPSWGGGGLDHFGVAAVQSAATAGATLDIVNLMTMDFGGSYHNGSTMAQLTQSAATAAVAQLAPIYPGKTNAQLWAMLGITPMIGVNDVAGETFTTADATTITQFAQAKGVGHLSYWALQRDRPGSGSLGEYSQVSQSLFQFYNTFKAATGPVTPGPASIAVTAVYSGDATKITTQPNITVQAVCGTSGTKSTTFKPPAGGSIAGLVGGESCTLSETALSGAVLASGYSLSAPNAATFTPASPVFLFNGANAVNVRNQVLGGGTGGTCQPAWSATQVYVGGNKASRNNVNYTANWWTQGNDPATNNGGPGTGQPWTSNGPCQ
ncbi:glycosyl hydrolase family 18 protein [Tahibacter soli]|uniref:Glycosyl hydrolase family 18 protein n=1 Tax=Tahibacter soli TaxID=2983605 RepID=A0A9X3YRP3_9GAMM|nr:glycosyl hydrolase family 18 protein [Tahibacter soli]MDC8015888.1 glycosyl hydrolase family 18 protein [Tahibacter soli]